MSDYKRYIIVTPVKNEEKNLDLLIKSVLKQKIKPVLWVFVNDNSTDKSTEILQKYSLKYDFIKIVNYPYKIKEYDPVFHYSEVCKYGFDRALKYCKKNSIDFDYIGLLDADIFVEENFFLKLINEFHKDDKLGIISGNIFSLSKNKKHDSGTIRFDIPRGGARLWSKDCFLKTGGYMVTYSPDTISNIKAKLMGFHIKTHPKAIAYQVRETASKKGKFKGWFKNGIGDYYLRKRPIAIVFRVIKLLQELKFIAICGYVCGYFYAFINHIKRIDDNDIAYYFKKTHIKDVLNYWLEVRK